MRNALFPLILVAALLATAAAPVLAADGPRSPTGAENQDSRGGSPSDEESPATPTEEPADDGGRGRGRSGETPGATTQPSPEPAPSPTPAGASSSEEISRASDEEDEGEDEEAERGRGRGRGGDARPEVAPVGSFELEQRNQTAMGEFVSFSYNDTGVQGFSAGGVTLFNLTARNASEDGERGRPQDARIRAQGAQMRLDVDGFRFTAHDAPTAVARAQLDSGEMVLDFVPGATVEMLDGGRARFSVGNLTGTLKGDGLVVRGSSVSASDDLLVVLDTPRGAFDKHRQDIGQAISKGHVGAEATFSKVEGEVKQDVVSYGNVTMTTVKAEPGNLTILVEGHGLEGRVLVLNVDARVLGAASADDLSIMLDNLTIHRASNLTDILDPDDDGFLPEYYIVHDEIAAPDAYQLIVTVPHYSVHTLSVTSAFVLPPPSVVIGVVAGLIVLVPSAFVLFRRK